MAHSKGDDDRDPGEVQGFWARDPLTQFRSRSLDKADSFEAIATSRVEDAVARAESASHATLPKDLIPVASRSVEWLRTDFDSRDRVVNRIHAALRARLEADERVFILGEDIEGPYGGAFKVTKDLSLEFPGRLRNTPISEAAIVGIGAGLALAGKLPVCEVMFGDFLALAFDQILNSAAKFNFMYNEQVETPLVIRAPMGGRRGYGPTHSQSIEKHFMGIPGTVVVAPHHRYDPALLYERILTTCKRPTLVIENKLLYGERISPEVEDQFTLEHSNEGLPTTRIRPGVDPDLTIVCYGGMLRQVEAALAPLFEDYEILCEVLCPTQLYPLNAGPILDSVRQTRRLLVVEEGIGFAAFGSEVIAQLCELLGPLPFNVRRLASAPVPIPSSPPLERAVLPGTEDVVEAARATVGDA